MPVTGVTGKVEIVSDYKGGSKMVMDQRISGIVVKGDWGNPPELNDSSTSYIPVTPGLIRKYKLTYAATRGGNQSLLDTVCLLGLGDKLCHKFTYQGQSDSEQGFEEILNTEQDNEFAPGIPNLWPLKSARFGQSQGEVYPGVRWVDVNGDALADMVWGRNTRGKYYAASQVGGKALAKAPLSWAPINDPQINETVR